MSERDIFIGALQADDPAERRAYLEAACGADDALRRRVDGLLEVYGRAGSFLEGPAGAAAGTGAYAPPDTEAPAPAAEAGALIAGRYKLLEVVGEGGMGTVWMADQTEPVRRKVAVKVIKAGMDSRQVLARFEAERQALALMDHPNIAKVLDAGTTPEGRPYFVMELVKGVPITRYCDDHHLTPRQRLELFAQVCQAVQHAHQKGVIHRDLKPSNVLIAPYDGRPVPKVIDFGVAKATGQPLTEKTLFTALGAVVGTPEYMSPEQAELNNADVDTRSDVFSLGVLLYELLTGSTPLTHKRLKAAALLEVLRLVREEEPPKPSTRLSTAAGLPSIAACRGLEPRKLSAVVCGELDWIVMKALEKDRNRRYETATGFAADVQRYLADEAVQACPPSVGYRVRKFARRNKTALATAGVVLVAAVGAAATLGWALRDRHAREQQVALEAARQLDLTEGGVRDALGRGAGSRAELQAVLRGPGGVQQLLNQPARWEQLLTAARAELALARQLAARAGGSLDGGCLRAMDEFEQRLAGDQSDYELARRLETIRLDTVESADGWVDYRPALRDYPGAFAGLAVPGDDTAGAAARVAASPIRDQLVAALDHWAYLSFFVSKDVGLTERLLAVARGAAPDPAWGDRIRRPGVWRDREALVRLVAQAPDAGLSPQLMSLIGSLLNKDQAAAESWLRRAQAVYPADYWLNRELATVTYQREPAEAAGYCRVAIAVRPGNSEAYNLLGNALRLQKRLPEAVNAYRTGITLNPKRAGLHSNLGLVMHDLNELPEAVAACRRALELDPENAHAHCTLGMCLVDLGKPDEAIAAYRRAIELDPKYVHAYSNLGSVLSKQKRDAEALPMLLKALEIDPAHAPARANLGGMYYRQGKMPEAEAAFRTAIEINPTYAKAHMWLADALRRQGKSAGAIRAYRRATELDPTDARAHHWAAWMLTVAADRKLRDPEQALAPARRAVQLKPKDGLYWQGLGYAEYRSGNWKAALVAFEKVKELGSPGDCLEWFPLAIIHWQLGNKAEARRYYDRAVQWNETHPYHDGFVRELQEEAAGVMGIELGKQ